MIDFAVQFCCHTQWNIRAEEQSVSVTDQSSLISLVAALISDSFTDSVEENRWSIVGLKYEIRDTLDLSRKLEITIIYDHLQLVAAVRWSFSITREPTHTDAWTKRARTRTHVHKDTHGRVSCLSALCSELYTR